MGSCFCGLTNTMPKNKKKVLLITVRADIGGGPRHVELLVKGLPYPIFLACPPDKPYYFLWKENQKVKGIQTIPHRKFSIIAYFRLTIFCIKHKIDAIHSHGKGAGIYSRFLKILLPHVYIIHTFHGIHLGNYTTLKRVTYLFLERLLSFLTNRFINVSYGEQKICWRNKMIRERKSIVIYNGIDEIERRSIKKEEILNEKGKFVITTISRFDYPKNMTLALKVAEALKDFHDIQFLWVGDGENRSFLEASAKSMNLKNILFAGYRNDIDRYLSITDIYLSTSRWEGLPFSLIEALSLGIPIIATDVVGNNEVVNNGHNGLLFKPDHVEDAKIKILSLYYDKELYGRYSDNAYTDFKGKFSKEKMLQRLAKIYASI